MRDSDEVGIVIQATPAEPHDDDDLVIGRCELLLRALSVAVVMFALLCAITTLQAQEYDGESDEMYADPRPEEPDFGAGGGGAAPEDARARGRGPCRARGRDAGAAAGMPAAGRPRVQAGAGQGVGGDA